MNTQTRNPLFLAIMLCMVILCLPYQFAFNPNWFGEDWIIPYGGLLILAIVAAVYFFKRFNRELFKARAQTEVSGMAVLIANNQFEGLGEKIFKPKTANASTGTVVQSGILVPGIHPQALQ